MEVVGGLVTDDDVGRTMGSTGECLGGREPTREACEGVDPTSVADPEPVAVDETPGMVESRPMEEAKVAEGKAVDPRSREFHRFDPLTGANESFLPGLQPPVHRRGVEGPGEHERDHEPKRKHRCGVWINGKWVRHFTGTSRAPHVWPEVWGGEGPGTCEVRGSAEG